MSELLGRRLKSHADHRPSPDVQETMAAMRAIFMATVSALDEQIPECREKALAVTALEEAAMWALKALAVTDPSAEVSSP
jgi:hypothetical protein